MATVLFDTLKYAEELKAGGFNDLQIKAQVKALSEIFDVNAKELATRQDVAHLEQSTDSKFDLVRKDIQMVDSNLRKEMSDMKYGMLKWGVGLLLAQSGFFFALLRLFPPVS